MEAWLLRDLPAITSTEPCAWVKGQFKSELIISFLHLFNPHPQKSVSSVRTLYPTSVHQYVIYWRIWFVIKLNCVVFSSAQSASTAECVVCPHLVFHICISVCHLLAHLIRNQSESFRLFIIVICILRRVCHLSTPCIPHLHTSMLSIGVSDS